MKSTTESAYSRHRAHDYRYMGKEHPPFINLASLEDFSDERHLLFDTPTAKFYRKYGQDWHEKFTDRPLDKREN